MFTTCDYCNSKQPTELLGVKHEGKTFGNFLKFRVRDGDIKDTPPLNFKSPLGGGLTAGNL